LAPARPSQPEKDVLHVFPGRHQPPHRDHLAILRLVLGRLPSFVLGLIVDVPGAPRRTAFEREARRQNLPARCPFSFLERAAMIEAALTAGERRRIRILALPRPEAAWPLVEAMLPGPRTWIVPDAGEAFDDAKARFFRSKGDRVLRLPFRPTTDGRVVRSLLHSPRELRRHVPPAVAERIALWRGTRRHT
jgi:nicotinamide mononucleotide adenylyltransferase